MEKLYDSGDSVRLIQRTVRRNGETLRQPRFCTTDSSNCTTEWGNSTTGSVLYD
ncbi:MAG: hypothetical protein ABS920_11775 [Sporosarcina sp.]